VGWKGQPISSLQPYSLFGPHNYELTGCLQTRGASHPSMRGTFHHHVYPSSTGIRTISQ